MGENCKEKIVSRLFFFFFNLKGGHASVAIFCCFGALNMTVQRKAVTLLSILLEKSYKRCSVSVLNTQHKTNGLVNLTEVVVFYDAELFYCSSQLASKPSIQDTKLAHTAQVWIQLSELMYYWSGSSWDSLWLYHRPYDLDALMLV